jgi:hypothetical protein
MEIHGTRFDNTETLIGAANNCPRLGIVDTALRRFMNNSLFYITRISHEFGVYGFQLMLIWGVSFYFVQRKGTIIEILTIQPLYSSFTYSLLTIYLTDHFIYFTDRFIYFTDQIIYSRFFIIP